ncbi:uncharacterized protein RAG0_11837 [Rhynchosporium agropyri]|uniref:Uncharacterized protein n=1 Tax=Rhynchosporium agropyri TaxID=914238 RepID=A0A1E1L5T4_9HELO|nr:uncharacterized protein RAG0_11837 [Rhynchosporium agropyri]
MTTNLTTSLALTTLTSPTKRKATTFEHDISDVSNSENIDPTIFLSPKRSKHPDGTHTSKDNTCKPSPVNYFLTRAPSSPNDFSCVKPVAASRPMLTARSPARTRIDTTRAAPLSAPAGRSPTRKRIGILNRRKTGSPFTRVDPPRFNTSSSGSGLGFSIDAALSGTIPSYTARQAAVPTPAPVVEDLPIPVLHTETARESWFFEIHEDTEEELATNLMEHGACTLDISSDEESAERERDNRGKENVPPLDDVSQTRTALSTSSSGGGGGVGLGGEMDAELKMQDIKARLHSASRRKLMSDENAIEVDRAPLSDLPAEEFYAEIPEAEAEVEVIEPSDAGAVTVAVAEDGDSEGEVGVAKTFDFTAEVVGKGKAVEVDIEGSMVSENVGSGNARLLEPIEKVEEGWSVWESGSATGDE